MHDDEKSLCCCLYVAFFTNSVFAVSAFIAVASSPRWNIRRRRQTESICSTRKIEERWMHLKDLVVRIVDGASGRTIGVGIAAVRPAFTCIRDPHFSSCFIHWISSHSGSFVYGAMRCNDGHSTRVGTNLFRPVSTPRQDRYVLKDEIIIGIMPCRKVAYSTGHLPQGSTVEQNIDQQAGFRPGAK